MIFLKINTLKILLTSMLLVIASFAAPSFAVEQKSILIEDQPSFMGMVGDALVARPLSLVATVAGATLYVVTLPFSIAGGNHKQAAKTLVRTPAYHTFARCLGCTVSEPLQTIQHHEATQHTDEH